MVLRFNIIDVLRGMFCNNSENRGVFIEVWPFTGWQLSWKSEKSQGK